MPVILWKHFAYKLTAGRLRMTLRKVEWVQGLARVEGRAPIRTRSSTSRPRDHRPTRPEQ